MRNLRLSKIRRCLLALAAGVASSALAAGQFVPGHIYVTHAGDPKGGPTTPTDRVFDIDPNTGGWSVLTDFGTRQRLGDPVFTPDRSRLRVGRFQTSEILEIDPAGSVQPVYTSADGVLGPADSEYDRFGNFYVLNNGGIIRRFPFSGGPPSTFALSGVQGVAMTFGASGDLYCTGFNPAFPFDYQIRRITPTGQVSVFDSFSGPLTSLAGAADGTVYAAAAGGILRYMGENSATRTIWSTGVGGQIALSPDGVYLYACAGAVARYETATAQDVLLSSPTGLSASGITILIPEPNVGQNLFVIVVFGGLVTRVRRVL